MYYSPAIVRADNVITTITTGMYIFGILSVAPFKKHEDWGLHYKQSCVWCTGEDLQEDKRGRAFEFGQQSWRIGSVPPGFPVTGEFQG